MLNFVFSIVSPDISRRQRATDKRFHRRESFRRETARRVLSETSCHPAVQRVERLCRSTPSFKERTPHVEDVRAAHGRDHLRNVHGLGELDLGDRRDGGLTGSAAGNTTPGRGLREEDVVGARGSAKSSRTKRQRHVAGNSMSWGTELTQTYVVRAVLPRRGRFRSEEPSPLWGVLPQVDSPRGRCTMHSCG